MNFFLLNKPESKISKAAPIITFLTLLFVFALIYSQSPLFTSNQNQYFLHGLARAGYGDLDEDWLANTAEPTPLFSWIVQYSFQIFQIKEIFYLYYALLMGIYIYSLLNIVFVIFNFSQSRSLFLLYTAALLLIHSAAIRFFNSRVFGSNWTYILEDGVADQRLLGPVFQPSAFGVLLLASILLFLKQKPYWSILCSALAATIHPTYLLTAGSLVLSYMFITIKEDRSFKRAALYGFFGLFLVLPVLIYIYSNFTTAPPETLERAQEILINFRIPHHARVSDWLDTTAIVKLILILSALYLVRFKKIFLILFIPFLIATTMTVLQIILDNNTLALIFPWRVSAILVPLSSSILLAELISIFIQWKPEFFQKYKRGTEIFSAGLIIILMVVGAIRMTIDFNRKVSVPERDMMDYVSMNHQQGDQYLVPKKMQDFRLATGAPVFGEFKSIPYNPEDVLEWRRRVRVIEEFYKETNCDSFGLIMLNENVNRFVVPQNGSMPVCETVSPIYEDHYYWIYAPVPVE
jgi:hypothetical protein